MSRRPSTLVRLLAMLLAATFLAPGSTLVMAAAGPSLDTLLKAGAAEVKDVYVRPSQAPAEGHPVQVVIALHGMGGNGHDFANNLAKHADRYGWIVVAPTIQYGDWTDPDQISREDPALIAWLSDEVHNISQVTGADVLPEVLVFGHSRGAQLALRFAEIHPGQVAGVAAVSAGTYTLPMMRDPASGHSLEFPFGMADLAHDDGGSAFDAKSFRSVPVWIGVGADDNNPNDVPDAWDAYLGDDRRERAETFSKALDDMGMDVTLSVFPGAGHGLSDDMRSAACAALAEASAEQAEAEAADAASAQPDSAH